MSRPLAWLLLLSSALAAVPVPAQAQGAGVEYRIVIDCPVASGTTIQVGGGDLDGGCPVRAIDGADLMGDPSLAVDPLRPENLILASLHGQVDGRGPTPKSRSGQVFTTFTSQESGAFWIDNPYFPPDRISGAFGEHPQVTIDPYGHVYVGSLYAEPTNGTSFSYVIGAQKFESIDTIDEEQSFSNGGYNVDYIRPIHEHNAIQQMWFLFNARTDNMTMVWTEDMAQIDLGPPCNDATFLLTLNGYYVVALGAELFAVWQESNGVGGLQTPETCPLNPDTAVAAMPAEVEAALGALQGAARGEADGSPARSTSWHAGAAASPLIEAPWGEGTVAQALAQPPPADAGTGGEEAAAEPETSAAPDLPAPAPAPSPRFRVAPVAAQNLTYSNLTAPGRMGVIGVVWTTSAVNTSYHRQAPERVIGPCSTSTNPVLSDGYLYIGCVAAPEQAPFRWNNDTRSGAIELFRMDPDGGVPVYMGQAPDVPGEPRLGVRSDGRLALVGADAEDGRLVFKAAFGRYDPGLGRIAWTRQLHLGNDIAPVDPDLQVRGAHVQDVIYREQSGVLHLILKTTVDYTATIGSSEIYDDLNLAPHIQKSILAVDEEYGLLATVPLLIGDPVQRAQDSTIFNAPEAAFQDISDDFLQLPPGPHSFQGTDLGDLYQREFFAVADYGTVLFAELVEITNLRAPGYPPPPAPPAPVPSATTTNLMAPVVGVSLSGAIAGTLAINRRKNYAAAFTKGE